MQTIYVKLRQAGRTDKYRKLLSTEQDVYDSFERIVTSSSPYTAGAIAESGEWFSIKEASKQPYAIDLIQTSYESVDLCALSRAEFPKISFLFAEVENSIYFQNVSRARLVSKKRILCFGEDFEYNGDCADLVINDLPDAVYHRGTDTLYFRKLESITRIFKGIDQLYKEATNEEVQNFLCSDFISIANGYSAEDVKTPNRKRIALAQKTLSTLNTTDKSDIFRYIKDYCPKLASPEDAFEIGSEDQLKLLLFGIEQRFYTTPVGGEKRIANSVIRMD